MKLRHWITVVVLLMLVVGNIVGVFLTDSGPSVLAEHLGKNAGQPTAPLVDQRAVQNAKKLAALASTPEEQDFVHQALRLSDYVVDLAFADALREATEHPPAPTPEQRQLTTRAAHAQTVVKNDQGQIAHLTHQLTSRPTTQRKTPRINSTSPRRNSNSIRMNSRTRMRTCNVPEEIRRVKSSTFSRSTKPVTPTRFRRLPAAPTPNIAPATSLRRSVHGSRSGKSSRRWRNAASRRSMTSRLLRARTTRSISG